MQRAIVAIDIGGTNLKYGVIENQRLRHTTSVPVHAHEGKRAVVQRINKSITALMNPSIAAIGVSMPGPADYEKGVFFDTANLPLARFAIQKHLERQFNVPVHCIHDAHAFALGESLYGGGRGKRTVVGITLGTGTGFGIIHDGEPWSGRANAGELGHVVIEKNGATLEDYLGDSKKKTSILGKRGGAYWASEAYHHNPNARAVWKKFGAWLGRAVIVAKRAYDPDIVLVGGNVAKAWPFFNDAMRREIDADAFSKPCPVKPSTLRHAALWGAAAIARAGLEEPPTR